MSNRFILAIGFGLWCTGLLTAAAAQSNCDPGTQDRVNQLYERMGQAAQNQQFDIAIGYVRQLKAFSGRCGVMSSELLEGVATGFVGMRDNPQVLKNVRPCNPVQTGPYSYSC